MKANEDSLPAAELDPQLDALEIALAEGDHAAALAILRRLVPEYRSRDDAPEAAAERS
jgi:hypothetical protein